MKLSKTTISTLLLASLIGFQLLSINVHSVISAPNIYVNNPATGNNDFIFYTNTTPVGSKFNATLLVSGYGNPPVYAWQVRLNYDSTHLNITRAWTATDDPAYIFAGRESIPQKSIGDSMVMLGDSLLGAVTGETPPPEPAKLATIEFTMVSAPVTQNLLSSLDINNVDTYLLDEKVGIIPSVTKTSGQYQYIDLNLPNKVPSTITVSVNPASVLVGDYVTISGTITPTRPNAQVTINAKFSGYDWFTLANVMTDSGSSYLYVWRPMNAAVFQIQSSWLGDQATFGDDSPVVTLTVSFEPPPPPPHFPAISVVNPLTGDSHFTSNIGLGRRFNATVWAYNITDLFAYQVYLTVDDTLLNITRAWIPTGPQWVFNGKTALTPAPILYDSNTDGSNEAAKMGATIIDGEAPTFNGTGLLAIIEFKVIRAPGKYENLTCNLDISNSETYLLDSNLNVINVTKESGYYEFSWAVPGFPETMITVTNPLTGGNQFIFFANTTVVGDRFNATLWINEATEVSSWQVTLTYRPDLLNATRAWIPETDARYIFNGFSTLLPTPALFLGRVIIGDVTVPVSSVSFTTPKILGIIEFQIIQAPPDNGTVFSNLAIDNIDTYLIDPEVNEIPTSKMNGYYQYIGLGGTPSAPTEVMVMPPHLNVGDPYVDLPTPPFTLDIVVTNVTDLYAWQVKIYFNPTLNVSYSNFPQGHVFSGREFTSTPLVVGADEFSMYLMIGANLFGNQTGFSGSGTLCQLTFIGIAEGNSPLIFASLQNETMLLNSRLEAIPFDVIGGFVTVLGIQPPPPLPPPPKEPSKINLYASPQTVFAGQSVFLTGEIVPWRQYRDVMIFARQTNGTVWLLLNTVQTNQYSQFNYTWVTDTPGWYELKATWSGDEYTYPAESPIQFVQVQPKPAHELVLNLTAPDYTLPDASTALDVSVHNLGATTETNVQIELFIQGTLVTSETIPTLTSGSTYTLQFMWKPQTEGTYNILASVPIVPGEYDPTNNRMTTTITVAKPLIHPTEGQWTAYNLTMLGGPSRNLTYVVTWNFTYFKYISPALINVTMTSTEYQPGMYPSGWMIVNIVTRQVERDSGIYWAGMWYPGWIEKDIDVGSVVHLLNLNVTVTGSEVIETMGRQVDCWRFDLAMPGGGYYSFNYTFWYDKATGVWIAMEVTVDVSPPIVETLALVGTNIPIGSALKIETDKAMYVRSETATIQATYKIGDTPIENAQVLVEVDYPNGALWFTWTMTTDATGSASMSFFIPDLTAYGTYTIHATAYKTGMPVSSATTTFRVVHYQAELTMWFEGPDIALVNQEATIILHVKNIGNLTAQATVDWSMHPQVRPDAAYSGPIGPGEEWKILAPITVGEPNKYNFDAIATYTWQGSNEAATVQAHRTLIYAYHPDYPVDLLNMTVSVIGNKITVNLTVINYGDSPVEITLIASAQQTGTELMLGSVYQKITINPGQTITISLTITIPWTPAQGEYDVQGILATGLPHEGGFALTHREEKITV